MTLTNSTIQSSFDKLLEANLVKVFRSLYGIWRSITVLQKPMNVLTQIHPVCERTARIPRYAPAGGCVGWRASLNAVGKTMQGQGCSLKSVTTLTGLSITRHTRTEANLQLGDQELASGDWGGVIPLVIFLPRGYVSHINELY
jgi:hypothetical protein